MRSYFNTMLPNSVSSILRTKLTTTLVVISCFIFIPVRGEIRCYCNLPVCISTGYMCKSSRDTCFTEHFAFSSDLAQSRHGCSELLPNSLRVGKSNPCSSLPRRGSNDVLPDRLDKLRDAVSPPPEDIFPSLFCCQEDMCNYVNAMDIHVQVQAKSNNTHRGVIYSGDKSGYPSGGLPGDAAVFGNQDLWFKAAVIAVPIAGSFVLVLLILLAAHMLKQDSKRQRHLSELRRQRQYKARLLLGEVYAEKGENPFQYCGHYSEIGGGAYATDYLVSANKKGETNYQDFVYERPVSVSLCGSFLPLARWDNNDKSPAFV